jgi:CO/xanthine dehydrogenase Mo-binding subunit
VTAPDLGAAAGRSSRQPAVRRGGAGVDARVDAWTKGAGSCLYTADISVPGVLHAAIVRSPVPHATIAGLDVAAAADVAGVVAVFTARDLPQGLGGRRVRDTPLLATDKVRFVGDRVAAVVALDVEAAQAGAAAVEVDYQELPAVTDPVAALQAGAPAIHDSPWRYPGAVVAPGDPPNLQSQLVVGDQEAVDVVLSSAAFTLDRTYRTPAGHQGYLEPHAWLAEKGAGGRVRLWATTKSPYRLRQQIADCLDMSTDLIDIQPVPLGGDFGGKGALGEAALCVAIALQLGRPVRLVLQSGEDITATDARHPSVIRVRLGCDGGGRLVGLAVDAVFAGGAYAASKPVPSVNLHGAEEAALGYRWPAIAVRSRIAYTNAVPKGHMRAPGAPQTVFAVERALDELASAAGINPVELRRRNLLPGGEPDAYGHVWPEARGVETLEAALSTAPPSVTSPAGWLTGRGVAVYARPTPAPGQTSMRLSRRDDEGLVVDVPFPETGTGSHSVVRHLLAERLGVPPATVEVRQAPTGALGYDPGVGASRVTVGISSAVAQLARRWEDAGGGAVSIETEPGEGPALAYCAQEATVAIDPETGELKVLRLVSAVDVAEVLRPASHQLQIDGGALMGWGFACLEDLLEQDGQPWAANLSEFKLPAAADSPDLGTVLVTGGRGVGPSNVKSVGELSNVAVAAAIANAVADAAGAQIRDLPITAERIYWALHGNGRS